MHWILESNLNDFGYQWLIKVLERHNIKYTMVKVIPYQNILVKPDFDSFSKDADESDNIVFDSNELIFPFGTMGLSRVSDLRNWKPGALTNEEFTFENWSKGFGLENLLNEKSKIMAFGDEFDFDEDIFFARPCEDNKAFSGQVLSKEKFLDWQKVILELNDKNAKLTKDTMITIAPFQQIKTEARMFIFEGKVVTGSYYKLGSEVTYREVIQGDPIIDYANKMVENYQPVKAFVIDIALTEDGYKIIEINALNSVGLYRADVEKIVFAVEETFGK